MLSCGHKALTLPVIASLALSGAGHTSVDRSHCGSVLVRRNMAAASSTATSANVEAEVHPSDSEEIMKNYTEEEIRAYDEAAPRTPNGTPLPRGPPPPTDLRLLQPVAFRVANAVSQAMAEEGVEIKQVLALIPESYRTMDSLVIKFQPLTANWADHPNILITNPSEDEVEADVEEATGTVETVNPAGDEEEALEGETNMEKLHRLAGAGAEGEVARMIIAAMDREGRSLMSNEETTLLGSVIPQSHMSAAADEDDEEAGTRDSGEAGSASTSVSGLSATAAHAVATAPWRGNTRVASTPSGSNRKLGTQSAMLFCKLQLLNNKHPYLRLGVAEPHSLSSSHPKGRIVLWASMPYGCGCTLALRALRIYSTCGHTPGKTIASLEIEILYGECTPCNMQSDYSGLARYVTDLFSENMAGDLQCYSETAKHMHRTHTNTVVSRILTNHLLLFLAVTQMVSTLTTICLLLYLAKISAMNHTGSSGKDSPPSKRARSRAGPKSGGVCGRLATRFLLRTLMLCMLAQTVRSTGTDARVDAVSTTASGTDRYDLPVKHSGAQRTIGSETQPRPLKIGKRTYNRAYARAVRMGGTPFRGKWRPLEWFTPRHIFPQYVGKTKSETTTAHSMRVLSWNSGGLTMEVFQELQTFATAGDYDLILVQETKWRHDSTWSTDAFHFIHSQGHNKEDKVAGLLVMVAVKHTKAGDIQHSALHHGRLLHVRFPKGQTHIDILNYYHIDNEGVYENRHKLLTKLQRTVAGLPARNTLLLAGDFNCPFEPNAAHCGRCVLPHNTLHYKDFRDHQHVVEALHLCVLNSWSNPRHGQLATFTFGKLASQIDYVMMRKTQATPLARRAQVLANFPVAAWREGANHHPVEAYLQVPRNVRHLHTKSVPQPARFDKEQLQQDLQMEPTPALLALREEAAARIQGAEDANKVLLEAAIKHYPTPPRPQTPPSQPAALANCAKHTWAIFRQMKAQKRTAKGVLTAWHLWTRFQQAHKVHKQRSRRRTRDKRDELLAQAQQAAEKGNTFGLWKVVKQLAPKAPRRRLQLHRDGCILNTADELAWIVQAFGDRYGMGTNDKGWEPQGHAAPYPLVQASELAHLLSHLNVRKAVPRDSAPALLWKACGAHVANIIADDVSSQWLQTPTKVDNRWSDAEVALLVKAHGRMNTPLDLRPIGLQDPLGKGIMSILIQQAREEISHLIRRFPQTAYIAGRSTSTALRQVFSHCRDVRQMTQGERLTIHQRKDGRAQAQCCGGLQISLDLSAAFDLLRWQHIKEALDLAGTPLFLQEILLTWLVQVRYIFWHRDQSDVVTPKWGLRQGCTASPLLWSAFTSLLCITLEAKLGDGWTSKHATLYADDSHLRWRFFSFPSFEHTMREVRIALNVFRSFNLQINIEKTKAILKVVGTMRTRVYKEYIRKTGKDTPDRLLLSPRDPEQWLPLVPQTEYLGLIISYGAFELQSLRHRVSKANGRRWAMASILHSKKMGVGYKLQFWRSCVLSIMTYGLHCCGLTGDQAQEAQRAQMKHVRAIVNSQAHLTGDTHEQIMQRFNIPHFAELLRHAQEREARAADLHQDWMWSADWQQYLLQQLLTRTSDHTPDEEDNIWSCPICEASFTSAAALKTHARRTHSIVEEHPIVFNKALHSEGGLPTCSGCHKKFSKWQFLAHHINQNSCPNMIRQPVPVDKTGELRNMPVAAADDSISATICQQPDVVQASEKGINAFIPLKHITTVLRQTCGLCGQWCSSHRTVKIHYQYSHADLLQQLGANHISQLVTRTATAMFEDPDMNEFFGEVKQEPTAKRRRPEETSGKSQLQAAGGRKDELVITLARLAIKQEEELQVLKQDHSFMLFMRPGKDSILHYLFQTAGVSHLGIEMVEKDEAKRKEAVDMGWVTTEMKWKFQVWNPQLKCLQEDRERPPMSTQDIKALLERLYAAIKCDIVTRFSCTRRLTETMESQASFYFDLSSRGKGQEAWEIMHTLQGSCVLQLIGLGRHNECGDLLAFTIFDGEQRSIFQTAPSTSPQDQASH
ncbi:unnamed protein product [Symbiodinium sp. CCMP2592]|nr:unnamed protein product [Symbiodinium sp. CCMP2592]